MKKAVQDAIQNALDDARCRGPFDSFERAVTSVRIALDAVQARGLIESWRVEEDPADPNLLHVDVHESYPLRNERMEVTLLVDPELRVVWEVMES